MVELDTLKHCILLSKRNETFSCCSTLEKTLLSLWSTNIFPPKKVNIAQKHYLFLFSSYLMSQIYLLFTFVSVTCPKISLKLSVAVGSATQQGHTYLPYAMSSIQQPQCQNRTQNHSLMWDISFQDFTSGWIFYWKGRTSGSVGCGPLGFSWSPAAELSLLG